jgi:chorismate mutase
MDKLKELRNEIDKLDEQLIETLNKRAVLALEVRVLKIDKGLPIHDKQREQEILTKIVQENDGPLSEEHLQEIYCSILKCMKDFS